MKTTTLLIAITAFSLSAVSQSSSTAKPAVQRTIEAPKAGLICIAPSAESEDSDYFKMIDNQMRAVRGDIAFVMNGYRWLKNGTVLSENGKVTTEEGQITYLQNGESINGWGVITSTNCNDITGMSPNQR